MEFSVIDRDVCGGHQVEMMGCPWPEASGMLDLAEVLNKLRHLGCSVDMASNGFAVLEAIERQSYDIILMNICMPKMDGLKTAQIVRQRMRNNGPKIIALTANCLPGFREKCPDAGMNDYIGKPVTLHELAEVLGKHWPSH